MHDYLSIKPEDLEACTRLAREAPSQSPKALKSEDGDAVIWLVGDATFTRPRNEPVIEFLIDHQKYTFGKEWASQKYALPVEYRHVVMRWWFSLCEISNASAGPNHHKGQWYEVQPSGNAMEFMSLADDLYRLRLVDALRPKMLDRLRHHAEFQGARYECAIAASFIRCGFDVDWLSGAQKKCEFVATHKTTGESIAIEVKSRRRPGTLNETGERQDQSSLRADVKHLYEKALRQCPADKPCGIFIDVNLPFESAADKKRIPWEDDIKSMLDEFPESGPDTPATETCLVFTNFGWHFTGEDRAKGIRSTFTFPQYVRNHLTDLGTYVAILRTTLTYGQFSTVE